MAFSVFTMFSSVEHFQENSYPKVRKPLILEVWLRLPRKQRSKQLALQRTRRFHQMLLHLIRTRGSRFRLLDKPSLINPFIFLTAEVLWKRSSTPFCAAYDLSGRSLSLSSFLPSNYNPDYPSPLSSLPFSSSPPPRPPGAVQ